MECAVRDAAGAQSLATEVFEVYAVVVGADVGLEAWRESPWERHRARTGFRLATARHGGRLVGSAWATPASGVSARSCGSPGSTSACMRGTARS